MMTRLRPAQERIMQYGGGKMGIAAVPGSGKTWTLSLLAAEIVSRGVLTVDQEVLVVTLVNSAVDNFSQRVSMFLEERGLLPNVGYRVRTLHSLAHDIVRSRPALVGLPENFQIVDERESDSILDEAARTWLKANPYRVDDYLDLDLEEGKRDWVAREHLPDLVSGIAREFVRIVKNKRFTVERLEARLADMPLSLPLAEMGVDIYADYQRALVYRGAVDFDDLIHLALSALEADDSYLERLQGRWPYILEDEAQDSSELQEQIISTLVGQHGNWVRVGDPNQAIYETFTTADPRFLHEFMLREDVRAEELPNSGRSSQSIIDLANYLVSWTEREHPVVEARHALHSPPLIEPAPPGDPQPNPPDRPDQIYLVDRSFSPSEEVQAVVDSLERWLPHNPDATVAVLAPRNQRGFEVADELRKRGIEYIDSLLRSTSTTRFSAGALANILAYLADPASSRKLARAYRVWRREDREDEAARAHLERTARLLRQVDRVENFIWPDPGMDWLEQLELGDDRRTYEYLSMFRDLVRRWQASVTLPPDQILLALTGDLLNEPSELAISHKLSVLLRQVGQMHPDWQLPEMTDQLAEIARNERRFIGFGEDESGFDPDRYRGKVVISTVHKAKGLEWDRVYLMAVNYYNFPSGQDYDQYIAERWYIRDHLNLGAEVLAQLDTALNSDPYEWYHEGRATLDARLDYVRERLRLLYVGITRARRELVVTWNTGRRGDLGPALPLLALMEFWGARLDDREVFS